jgi:hypothetical protein
MQTTRLLRLALKPLLVLLVSIPFIVLVLALETAPAFEPQPYLSASELGEIEQIVLESAPESMFRVSQQQVRLDADQLNLMLRYGLQLLELTPHWAGQIALGDGIISTNLSISLSGPLSPFYINVEGQHKSESGQIVLQRLALGNFVIPKQLLDFAINRFTVNLDAGNTGYADLQQLFSSIEQASISKEVFSFNVPWQPELMARISSEAQQLFISDADRNRILFYYDTIKDVVSTIPADLRAVSLNTFLVPLFSAAKDASEVSGNPVSENRAVLQALAVYVNDENIGQLIGTDAASAVTAANFIEVRLQRRQDLAQHVMSIAAISASAGASLAQLLSTTKEAYDARYRSGFSFSDLTANSVGVAMAEFATQNPESAMEFQRRIIALEAESEYMPPVGNNRDGLTEADFSEQYTDRNSDEYRQRLEQIQELIYQQSLFQNFNQNRSLGQ